MALAALVLAVISLTWSAGWPVFEWMHSTRSRLRVRANFVIVPGVVDVTRGFAVDATNVGSVAATVNSVTVTVKGADGHAVLFNFDVLATPKPLPIMLEPGATWTGVIDAEEFRRAVAELAGGNPPPWKTSVWIGDASGRRHKADVVVHREPAKP